MCLLQCRFGSSISYFLACLSNFTYIASAIVNILLWLLFLPHLIFSHQICQSKFSQECLILPSIFQSITNFTMCIFSCCQFHFVLIFFPDRSDFFFPGQFLQLEHSHLPTAKVSLFPNDFFFKAGLKHTGGVKNPASKYPVSLRETSDPEGLRNPPKVIHQVHGRVLLGYVSIYDSTRSVKGRV